MLKGMLRTARYARSWKTGADALVEEVAIDRSGVEMAATLLRPPRCVGPLPGWIALGGVSRMGRHHPQLMRFARALASSGAAVLVPEVPEWRSLKMVPRVVTPTIRGCIGLLRSRADVAKDKLGLIGFSFGAPQVAIAAAQDDLAEHVAGIVLFGGYCSLERTMTCQLTGDHEWQGTAYNLRPDPFGGWVVASNHLTDVPGCEDAHDVAEALHALAYAASDQRIAAWEPHHDPMIEQLRAALPSKKRELFDLFAMPSTRVHPEPQEGRAMALKLAEACRRMEPLLDPADQLAQVELPTQLIHGRGDRLIPFTEGFRLLEGLPERARRSLTVTGLFNHTADHAPARPWDRARESLKMLGAIRGLVTTVR